MKINNKILRQELFQPLKIYYKNTMPLIKLNALKTSLRNNMSKPPTK